ncbi:hypothetical protein EMWEY_00038670 [Eimeria maxima]|uniref:Uncharacterized protein n=1 Tax=Eimeria maxima TaxID=5804 RepID=U6MHS1_EIMMA|nr:hypothetical protein EMWEY_00038670 [Eimeria maxima]CDJ61195.1 hypothetical protein EMWEY_00038670 [Eimeria maxima]
MRRTSRPPKDLSESVQYMSPKLPKMAKSAVLISLAFLAVLASGSSENSASSANSVAELEQAVSTPKQDSELQAQQNSEQQGYEDTRSPVIRKNYVLIFLLGVILLGLVRIAGARREPAFLQGTVLPLACRAYGWCKPIPYLESLPHGTGASVWQIGEKLHGDLHLGPERMCPPKIDVVVGGISTWLATGASTSDGGTLIMFSYSSCVQLFCVRAPVFPLDALRKVESYSLGLLDQRAQHEMGAKNSTDPCDAAQQQ